MVADTFVNTVRTVMAIVFATIFGYCFCHYIYRMILRGRSDGFVFRIIKNPGNYFLFHGASLHNV